MRALAAFACTLLLCAAHADELKRAGFLGVQIAPHPQGIAIRNLIEGGTAKAAGLREGDVITRFNGERATGPADFVPAVAKLHAGDRAAIEFLRGGETRTTEATIQPKPYESSPGMDTRYLSVEINGNRRRLIVTMPRAPGRHPAILYLTGIGCFSQESVGVQSNEAKLLYGLTEAGFVTMRVEKSGIGDSEGPSCSGAAYDLHEEIAGYVAGLLTLRQYEFVDPGKLFVMGLSIGGVEAPLVAEQAPVKGVIVLNTVARPFLDYLRENRRRQLVLRNVAYDEVEDRLALNDRCNRAFLVEKRSAEAIVAEEAACGDFIGYPAPVEYMRQWAALVPAKEWKRVEAPVLVVSGERDFVALASDAPYLRDMIESFHPGRATLATIPTMDHYLDRVASIEEALEKSGGGPFEPLVLEAVRAWLKRVAAS